jgi:hypothetical protein
VSDIEWFSFLDVDDPSRTLRNCPVNVFSLLDRWMLGNKDDDAVLVALAEDLAAVQHAVA